MGTTTLPRPTTAPRVALIWTGLWLAFGVAITTQINFDWTQDIAAYAENLEAQPDYETDSPKGAWYQYLVFPVMAQLGGNAEATLAAMKALIFALMFLSLRKTFRTGMDCALVLAVLLLTPALAHNMTEYLRQGTGLALLMLALSFPRRIVSIPLTAVAIFTHMAAALPALAYVCAWAVPAGKKRKHLAAYVMPVALTGAALIFGLAGGDLIRALAPEEVQDYLSGSRSNVLGLLYLALLAGYAGVRYSVLDSRAHLPVFIMFLAATASYSVLLNFGRTISVALPFHLMAAMTLPTARARYIDLAAVFVAGAAFAFASAEV